MYQDKMYQTKCTRQNVPRQNVPDKIYQTKCTTDKMYQRQNVPDKMYQTKCTRQNVPDKMYQAKCNVGRIWQDASNFKGKINIMLFKNQYNILWLIYLTILYQGTVNYSCTSNNKLIFIVTPVAYFIMQG